KLADGVTRGIDKMIALADILDNRVMPALEKLGPILSPKGLLGPLGVVLDQMPVMPKPIGGPPKNPQNVPGGGVGEINPMAPEAGAAPFMAPDAMGAGIGLAPFNLLGQMMDETQALLSRS